MPRPTRRSWTEHSRPWNSISATAGGSVDGTLLVAKDGHYVTWIRMKNREPIKLGKGVKLEIFHTQLVFAPAYDGGPVLPKGVEARVKGKAMFAIKFDEKERISYGDFERAIR